MDEVSRNLIAKFRVSPAKAEYRASRIAKAFPEALVEQYEPFVSSMTNHPKDRHVLAAAVASQAKVIVTYNLRDFPPDALSPFGIRAVDPSQFLIGLFHIDPIGVTHAIERQALEIKTPISALHERLAANVPDFARLLVAAKPEPRPYL